MRGYDRAQVAFAGSRIALLRQECQFTQAELARAVSVTTLTVSAWESGRTEPFFLTAVKVLRVLGQEIPCLKGLPEDRDRALTYLGKKLRSLRESKGLSQKEVSLQVDCSTRMVLYWENAAREPKLTMAYRLLQLYDQDIPCLAGMPALRPREQRRQSDSGKKERERVEDFSPAKLVRLRGKRSQMWLASQAGLYYTSVCRLERGAGKPRRSTLEKLARALEVEVKDLLL